MFMERFEMRSDLSEVVAMSGKVERVASECLEFLLEGRVRLHQGAMRRREGSRHRISLAHIDHVTRIAGKNFESGHRFAMA